MNINKKKSENKFNIIFMVIRKLLQEAKSKSHLYKANARDLLSTFSIIISWQCY